MRGAAELYVMTTHAWSRGASSCSPDARGGSQASCLTSRPSQAWQNEYTILANSNKAICGRRCEEVLTNRHIDVINEIYSDQIAHGDSQNMPLSKFKMISKPSPVALPDLRVTVYAQITEGDLMVTRSSATGPHLSDLMGNRPSGTPRLRGGNPSPDCYWPIAIQLH
jgi:hypothetical protein